MPLAFLLCSFAAVGAERTVILVRHAERAGGMDASVGISEAGRCRAESLARMLADAGVTRIFATDVDRTRQTAEPLARKIGIQTTVVPAKDTAGLVSRIRGGPVGETVFVVGHSNTVPEIVSRLGGGLLPPIDDAEYDRLYILTASAADTSVVLLRYPGCSK